MARPKTRIPLSVRNDLDTRRRGKYWLTTDGAMFASPADDTTFEMFGTPILYAILDDGKECLYKPMWTLREASEALEIPLYVLERYRFDMFEKSTPTRGALGEPIYYPIAILRKLRRSVDKSGLTPVQWLEKQRDAKRKARTAKVDKQLTAANERIAVLQRQLNTTLAVLDKLTRNRDDHRAKIAAVLARQGLTLPDAAPEQQTQPATS